MFYISVKKMNRLLKEINRLFNKGISSIYLKVTSEKVSWSVFAELQLLQISLNFKTSCYNLEMGGLGEGGLSVAFLLFEF